MEEHTEHKQVGVQDKQVEVQGIQEGMVLLIHLEANLS